MKTTLSWDEAIKRALKTPGGIAQIKHELDWLDHQVQIKRAMRFLDTRLGARTVKALNRLITARFGYIPSREDIEKELIALMRIFKEWPKRSLATLQWEHNWYGHGWRFFGPGSKGSSILDELNHTKINGEPLL